MVYLLTKNWLLHVSDSFGWDNRDEYTTSIRVRLLDEGIGRYQGIIDIRGLSGHSYISWRAARKRPECRTNSAASSMRFRDWCGLRSPTGRLTSSINAGANTEIQALRNCYASLTPREREVMALVVAGLLNKQVGSRLGISEITVKAHRGKMMQKMKADSLADLVKMAVRLRLAPARNPWQKQ